MKNYDFLVIGAGMSGAAAAYYLADHGTTVLLEQEDVPGYHSTGRSAAIFSEHHGPEIVCKLAKASAEFLLNPPSGFCDTPLLTERGILFTGTAEEKDKAAQMCESFFEGQAPAEKISVKQACEMMPFVDKNFLQSPAYYAQGREIDVAAMHQAFLSGLKSKGGALKTREEVLVIKKTGQWEVQSSKQTYNCSTIINAAGAWADKTAELAGFPKLGLKPKRRSVITVDLPPEYHGRSYPMTVFHDQKLYFKAENNQVLISPMDTSLSEPVDAMADEYDIALAAYLFEQRTGIKVKKINNSWAGLRSFFSDDAPIIEDQDGSGFIWLAGQGGYGIKIAEAMGRIVTAIACGHKLPEDVRDLGLTTDMLSSRRLEQKGHQGLRKKLA